MIFFTGKLIKIIYETIDNFKKHKEIGIVLPPKGTNSHIVTPHLREKLL